MVMACLIMEHDDGDPQKIQDAIQAALKKPPTRARLQRAFLCLTIGLIT
jgi:hypothetical protein